MNSYQSINAAYRGPLLNIGLPQVAPHHPFFILQHPYEERPFLGHRLIRLGVQQDI